MMSNAKSKSRSTSLSSASEVPLRIISARENRTVANVMENAVRVFTLMPKDLRDRLVEIASDKMAAAPFEELPRRLLFELARLQYEQASSAVATSGEVDEQMLADDEMVTVSSPVVRCPSIRPRRRPRVFTVVPDVKRSAVGPQCEPRRTDGDH
jgi:hypothetical protein